MGDEALKFKLHLVRQADKKHLDMMLWYSDKLNCKIEKINETMNKTSNAKLKSLYVEYKKEIANVQITY